MKAQQREAVLASLGERVTRRFLVVTGATFLPAAASDKLVGMVTILLPLLVCVVGAIAHLVSKRLTWLGLATFAIGLLWTIYLAMTTKVHL